MPPGVSSSVISKVWVFLAASALAPPSRPAPELAFRAPRLTVTVSLSPSSVLSSAAVRVRVAVLDAPVPPVKVIVGGLTARSVLARLVKATPVGSVSGPLSV